MADLCWKCLENFHMVRGEPWPEAHGTSWRCPFLEAIGADPDVTLDLACPHKTDAPKASAPAAADKDRSPTGGPNTEAEADDKIGAASSGPPPPEPVKDGLLGEALPSREWCWRCKRYSSMSFAVANEVWAQVMPERWRETPICCDCFAQMADERFVDWAAGIALFPRSAASLFIGASGCALVPVDVVEDALNVVRALRFRVRREAGKLELIDKLETLSATLSAILKQRGGARQALQETSPETESAPPPQDTE